MILWNRTFVAVRLAFIQPTVGLHHHTYTILEHFNSVDPVIRFTVEDNKEDGAIPFLNTIVKPEGDGRLYHSR